ncbi:MAG: DUF916 domain-containing protein [Actinomycetes bacterium]
MRPNVWRRRGIAIVATAAFACLGVVPAAVAANPSPTATPGKLTFGAGPANTAGSAGRSYFSFQGTTGARFSDKIALYNLSSVPITLRVYASDATTGSNGDFSVPDANARPKNVGLWTIPGKDVVEVPAGGTVFVPFTVVIPQGGEPGDYAGALMVSTIPKTGGSSGTNVNVATRIGVREYINVGGKVNPQLQVADITATYSGAWRFGAGTVTISYLLENTGNVRLGAAEVVQISSALQSKDAGPIANSREILPGSSIRESVRIAGVYPAGVATAHIKITPLQVTQFGIAPAAFTVTKQFTAVSYPIASLVSVIIFVLVGMGFWLLARRRRPRNTAGRHGGTPAPERVGAHR